MNYFFNSETGGLNTLHGWIGQVVDDSTWAYNHANSGFKHKLHTTQDIAGASYRCKVRIIGKSSDVKDIPDEQLPMAEMLLPVTAGSGHGGSKQTPNIRQGCYVFGFYKDGINATEPVIVGILPNDPRVPLFGGDPAQPFVQRSGYIGRRGALPVSTANIKIEGPDSLITAEGTHPNQGKMSHQDQNLDGKRSFYIPKTINCEGPSGEMDGLQKIIKQLLIDVKRARRFTQQVVGAVSNVIGNISSLISQATNFAAALVKSMMAKVRGVVVNFLNKQLTWLFDLLPPNMRPNAAQASELANNTLQCVFEKIISKLASIIKRLLEQMIEKYINAPMCAAEGFMASLISSILGELTSGIFAALGQVAGIVFDVAGILFKAFEIIIGILEFLTCKPDLDCQILDEWSFWDGRNLSLPQILDQSKFGKDLQAFVSSNLDYTGKPIPGCNSAQLPCGPPGIVFFGGGTIEGLGATGNTVVGLTGQIMGVDLVTGGRYTGPPNVNIVDVCGSGGGATAIPIMTEIPVETTYDPNAPIDSQNNLPPTPIYTVTNVVFSDPGGNYLAQPNDTTGGDGVIFSYPCETIVDVYVYPPGTVVGVTTGQIAYLPRNTIAEVLNEQNEVLQVLQGQGQLTPIPINVNGSFLTPECAPVIGIGTTSITIGIGTTALIIGIGTTSIGIGTTSIGPGIGTTSFVVGVGTTSGIAGIGTTSFVGAGTTGVGIGTTDSDANKPPNTYQVVACLEDIAILNEGVNYSPDDKIEITPSNGAEFKPVFDKFGSLKEVELISKGCGFVDNPQIRIISESGINATMVPVFSFKKIETTNDLDELLGIGLNTPVITVVDCVGKILR